MKRKEEGVQGGRRKKTKLPRLEGWGEKEGEDPPSNKPPTDPGFGSFTFQLGPELVQEPVKIPQNTAKWNMGDAGDWLDKENSRLMAKAKKKLNIKSKTDKSVAAKKREFKFQGKGSLKEDEIVELKRTHTMNIFSWVSKDKARKVDMVIQEEIETEMEVDCQEAHLERQSRLKRAEMRMAAYKAKRVCLEVMEDVLEDVAGYRKKELAVKIVEEVVVEVMDRVEVNFILGNCDMRMKKHLLDRLRREEERERMLEKQKRQRDAWKERWERLEIEMALELQALQEYEHLLDDMEYDEYPEGTPMVTEEAEVDVMARYGVEEMVTESMEEEYTDVEMELEEMEYVEYNDWLTKELEEMGIDWNPYEESMMVEESQSEYPHHHGGMDTPVHVPPTLSEKGWEGGHELGVQATGEGTPMKNIVSEDMQLVGARTPIGRIMPDRSIIQTPGLTFIMQNLDVEDDECLCSALCKCEQLQQTDRCIPVGISGVRTPIGRNVDRGIIHTPGLSSIMKVLEVEDDECLCSLECACESLEHNIDECICTGHCLEAGHEKKETEDKLDIRERGEHLGILYCPDPADLCLPNYIFKGYKPSTSRHYENINMSTNIPTICTESEDVVEEDRFENEVSLGVGVDSMIAVWEEMAKVDMLAPPLYNNSGGKDARRKSQEFTQLIGLFESGGGGEEEMQPDLKETRSHKLSSFKLSNFSKLTELDGRVGEGIAKKISTFRRTGKIQISMMEGRGHSFTAGNNITSLSKAVKRKVIADGESESSGGRCKRWRGGGGR